MKSRILLAAMAASLSCFAAQAADNTTFEVQADVSAACDVTATPLVFGAMNPLTAGTPVNGSSTIAVTCSNGTDYEIALDAGLGDGATVLDRKMTIDGGTDTLAYELYSDTERETNWGETAGTDTVAALANGTEQTHTVYGQITTGQTAAKVGHYTDTVAVTVTY